MTLMSFTRRCWGFLEIFALMDGFCAKSLDDNQLIWMVEVDGFIIDIRHAPCEMQIAAYENGPIQYIPTDQLGDEKSRSPK